ncbi:MAG: WYL domain-containing protein [Candidatus Hydrogenedens sp.]|nr:WYL domain-containing protein [Candidatus Hydrogenedentota bacterium]NLF57784.1 WYL domain-containing protein [Candidatus Hydrogenedens sp.]
MAENPYGSPGLRLVQMLILLGSSNGRQFSLTRLSQIFKCSRQTILRMLESLERVRGVKLESWMEGNERFYRINPQKPAIGVALDAQSLRHLCLCKDIVQHLLPAPIKEELGRTLGSAAFLNVESGEAPDSFAESRCKGMIDYTPHQKHLDLIQEALEANRLCHVAYRNKLGGPVREHFLGPVKLMAFREAFYVRGHTFDRKGRPEKRKKAITLAVHRITKLNLLDREFTPLRDDQPGDLFGFNFDPPFKVRVAFSPTVATYVSERTWSRGQFVRKRRDGGVVLTFTSTSRPEVKSWVLGFGREAELLEPKTLRREIAEELRAGLAAYAEKGAKPKKT